MGKSYGYWDRDDIRTIVTRMWVEEKKSQQQISDALRLGSRSAVASAIRRYKLPLRGPAQPFKVKIPKALRSPADKLVRLVSSNEPTDTRKTDYDNSPLLINGAPITILTVNDSMCRWPVSGSGVLTQFCGHLPKPGGAYCEAHAVRAFNPAHSPRVHAPRYG